MRLLHMVFVALATNMDVFFNLLSKEGLYVAGKLPACKKRKVEGHTEP